MALADGKLQTNRHTVARLVQSRIAYALAFMRITSLEAENGRRMYNNRNTQSYKAKNIG